MVLYNAIFFLPEKTNIIKNDTVDQILNQYNLLSIYVFQDRIIICGSSNSITALSFGMFEECTAYIGSILPEDCFSAKKIIDFNSDDEVLEINFKNQKILSNEQDFIIP